MGSKNKASKNKKKGARPQKQNKSGASPAKGNGTEAFISTSTLCTSPLPATSLERQPGDQVPPAVQQVSSKFDSDSSALPCVPSSTPSGPNQASGFAHPATTAPLSVAKKSSPASRGTEDLPAAYIESDYVKNNVVKLSPKGAVQWRDSEEQKRIELAQLENEDEIALQNLIEKNCCVHRSDALEMFHATPKDGAGMTLEQLNEKRRRAEEQALKKEILAERKREHKERMRRTQCRRKAIERSLKLAAVVPKAKEEDVPEESVERKVVEGSEFVQHTEDAELGEGAYEDDEEYENDEELRKGQPHIGNFAIEPPLPELYKGKGVEYLIENQFFRSEEENNQAKYSNQDTVWEYGEDEKMLALAAAEKQKCGDSEQVLTKQGGRAHSAQDYVYAPFESIGIATSPPPPLAAGAASPLPPPSLPKSGLSPDQLSQGVFIEPSMYKCNQKCKFEQPATLPQINNNNNNKAAVDLENLLDNNDEDDLAEEEPEDYSDTANERQTEYTVGGYHPVVINDLYNKRYRIVRKLGWGFFSTVWLVWDYETKAFYAMKVQKSASHCREAALDEIKLLRDIAESNNEGAGACVWVRDYFDHKGPNGVHVCMVFDLLGENLLTLIERYKHRGIPIPIVKSLTHDILLGLYHIHKLNIIHTDLKPENVLLTTPKHKIITEMKKYRPPPRNDVFSLEERDPKTLTTSQRRRLAKKKKRMFTRGDVDASLCDAFNVENDEKNGVTAHEKSHKSGDETASLTAKNPSSTSPGFGTCSTLHAVDAHGSEADSDAKNGGLGVNQTTSSPHDNNNKKNNDEKERNDDNNDYDDNEEDAATDPEWELERFQHCCIADFGNSCYVDNPFTDEVQTRQYRCPEAIVGNGYDCAIDMWSCACMVFELLTGEFLFDPKQGNSYPRDEDHLALIAELLGGLPSIITKGPGKFRSEYFDSRGNFIDIKDLNFCTLQDVLYRRHRFSHRKSGQIAAFLLPMLEPDPRLRATAEEMLTTYGGWLEIEDDDFDPLARRHENDHDRRRFFQLIEDYRVGLITDCRLKVHHQIRKVQMRRRGRHHHQLREKQEKTSGGGGGGVKEVHSVAREGSERAKGDEMEGWAGSGDEANRGTLRYRRLRNKHNVRTKNGDDGVEIAATYCDPAQLEGAIYGEGGSNDNSFTRSDGAGRGWIDEKDLKERNKFNNVINDVGDVFENYGNDDDGANLNFVEKGDVENEEFLASNNQNDKKECDGVVAGEKAERSTSDGSSAARQGEIPVNEKNVNGEVEGKFRQKQNDIFIIDNNSENPNFKSGSVVEECEESGSYEFEQQQQHHHHHHHHHQQQREWNDEEMEEGDEQDEFEEEEIEEEVISLSGDNFIYNIYDTKYYNEYPREGFVVDGGEDHDAEGVSQYNETFEDEYGERYDHITCSEENINNSKEVVSDNYNNKNNNSGSGDLGMEMHVIDNSLLHSAVGNTDIVKNAKELYAYSKQSPGWYPEHDQDQFDADECDLEQYENCKWWGALHKDPNGLDVLENDQHYKQKSIFRNVEVDSLNGAYGACEKVNDEGAEELEDGYRASPVARCSEQLNSNWRDRNYSKNQC